MIECALVIAGNEQSGRCPACGDAANWGKGPRLVEANSSEPLCGACGRSHAPRLIALMDLARTADKVGRHARHLLTPPMESLLELARAAETFAADPAVSRAKAG